MKTETWNLKLKPLASPPHSTFPLTTLTALTQPRNSRQIPRANLIPANSCGLELRRTKKFESVSQRFCMGLPTPHFHQRSRHGPNHSSALPSRSSTLPNCSSDFPKCSSRPQLEPLANNPIFTTLSRQTTYNFAPENSSSHLSVPLPLAGSPRNSHPQSTCNQYLRDHNTNHAANDRLLLAVLLYPRVRGAAGGASVVPCRTHQKANRPEDQQVARGFLLVERPFSVDGNEPP